MKEPRPLIEILLDKELARFGDAYLNFVYSYALTRASDSPRGTKVSDKILASASRISGLRSLLPKRTSTANAANAVEALVVNSYLQSILSIDETVDTLRAEIDNPVNALASLVKLILERMRSRGTA